MPQEMKKNLSEFRQVFFREKYRFDQGNAFLVFVNFSLLVITLVKQNGGSTSAIQIYVLGGLLATWFLGYILDRVVQIQDAQEKVVLKRSPIWQENFHHHGTHDQKLEELSQQINRLEKELRKINKKKKVAP